MSTFPRVIHDADGSALLGDGGTGVAGRGGIGGVSLHGLPHPDAFSMQRALHSSTLTGLDDPGPALTPAKAAALHDRPEGVAWFAIPAPNGAGVIARAHTEAHDGGQLMPGHLAACA
jgi:hypothetical protein